MSLISIHRNISEDIYQHEYVSNSIHGNMSEIFISTNITLIPIHTNKIWSSIPGNTTLIPINLDILDIYFHESNLDISNCSDMIFRKSRLLSVELILDQYLESKVNHEILLSIISIPFHDLTLKFLSLSLVQIIRLLSEFDFQNSS